MIYQCSSFNNIWEAIIAIVDTLPLSFPTCKKIGSVTLSLKAYKPGIHVKTKTQFTFQTTVCTDRVGASRDDSHFNV